MAADKWKIYDSFLEFMGDNTIDMDGDTFKVALYTSASNAATITNGDKAALTNEVANANGYTTGGNTLASVTWSQTSGTVTFDSADTVWTASGGSIVSHFAVIYSDTSITDKLVAFSLLDNTPGDITVTDGNTLTIQMNASGIFTGSATN